VILLTSIGEGIHRFVLAEFTQFGTNVISVAPGKTKTSGHSPTGIPTSVRPLTLDDARALARLPHVTGMTATVWGNTEVNANGRLRRTTVNGVSADMLKVFRARCAAASSCPPRTPTARAPSGRARREAQGTNCSAPTIRWARGCASAACSFASSASSRPRASSSASTSTTPPTSRPRARWNCTTATASMKIDLSPRKAYPPPASARWPRSRATLKARHGREDFTIITQEDMLRTLSNILDVLTMAVGALGSISLLVGGVGIVTIMTIAVTERTGEIGLLVALGARAGPSSASSSARPSPSRRSAAARPAARHRSGATDPSAGPGAAGAHAAQLRRCWPKASPSPSACWPGVLPARRAARLDAVEALRAE
jgi:putative ABC transport system permease protein